MSVFFRYDKNDGRITELFTVKLHDDLIETYNENILYESVNYKYQNGELLYEQVFDVEKNKRKIEILSELEELDKIVPRVVEEILDKVDIEIYGKYTDVITKKIELRTMLNQL